MINKKSTIKKLIAVGVLAILFAALTLLSKNVAVCEFFATTFARAWINVFGHIFGILPFSCYELFLIAAILYTVTFVVLLIVYLAKRRWSRALSLSLATVIVVLSFLNIYTATATMTYNRQPLPIEVYTEYSSEDLTFDQAVAIAEKIVDGANEAYALTEHDNEGNIKYPYDFDELCKLLAAEYDKIENKYFSSYTPTGKVIANKTIMSELHIVGVFFAPFGEANVNGNEDNLFLPHTLAHELAHAKGVMREYQADIVSLYVLLQSQDPYLRYGALVKCLESALSIVSSYPNSQAKYSELRNKIDFRILAERVNYSNFYSQFHHFDDLGEFFNNLYLKLQKQPDGTGSYVKPGEIVDTGDVDDDDNPIVAVLSFAGTQNLLINLFKQGLI